MICSSPVIKSSLTPITMVLILSSAGGTLKITFGAPAAKCPFKESKVLNLPVASTTRSKL